MDEAETAEHAFLGGRLLLREPRRGHRSGTDAVLLAAAARLTPGQHLIDVGAGAGAAALAALCRTADTTATLIERSEPMAILARHNAAANGLGDRVEVIKLDIFDKSACRGSICRRGDVVISNPPFYLAGTIRASTLPQRSASHVLTEGGHGDWFSCVLGFVAPRGRAVIIHRPDALPALLAVAEGRAASTLRSVHPSAGKAATRIILDAMVGRRSPMAIEPALTLHDADGAFTAFAQDLHQGRVSF